MNRVNNATTPGQKGKWTDRIVQAAALAGAVAGVATFLAEHPTFGLRLTAISLLIGGIVLSFRWRSGSKVRLGFTTSMALAIVGATALGWSIAPINGAGAPAVIGTTPALDSTPTGPSGDTASDGPIFDDGQDSATAPPSISASPTVHRQGRVTLTATTWIDLDSLAPDWDISSEAESVAADLRFSISDLSPVGFAELREAEGDGPLKCQQATAQFVLQWTSGIRDTIYMCAITNKERFASLRLEPSDLQLEYGVFSRITLTIVVYNKVP